MIVFSDYLLKTPKQLEEIKKKVIERVIMDLPGSPPTPYWSPY